MKVAVLSESVVDEAVYRILAEALLERPLESVEPTLRVRAHGWSAVLKLLPSVIKFLVYRSDADGLIVVLDSDDTPIHYASHEKRDARLRACRCCQCLQLIEDTQAQIERSGDKLRLNIAVGLAVPAIEAWLLCGLASHPDVSEAAWTNGLKKGEPPYSRNELKRRAYGSSRAGHHKRRDIGTKQAKRLSKDLDTLRKAFPEGFGVLERMLTSWELPERGASQSESS